MTLTDQTRFRLQGQIKELRRSPEWQFIRQLCTAECGQDQWDFDTLREEVLLSLTKALDDEIEAAKARYRAATGRP